jgi:hypothetical protein
LMRRSLEVHTPESPLVLVEGHVALRDPSL